MDVEEQLSAVFDASRDGGSFIDQVFGMSNLIVAVRDVEGRFLRVSRRLERIFRAFGIDPVGKTVFEVLPPGLARRIRENDLELFRTGRALQNEEELLTEGVRRTYKEFRVPLQDASGAVGALVGIAMDVTSRNRNEQALQDAALAVSSARRGGVFDQLVHFLARSLNVDLAFIARLNTAQPECATIVAGYLRGRHMSDLQYRLEGTPCEKVIGKRFEFVPRDLAHRFPADSMMIDLGLDSYAAYPLFDSDRRPLGLIAIAHRQPLANRAVIESMLRIFSARAGAELERQRAEQELEYSEANYREIFENAEDAIFVHDFDSGAILDVNPKACESYGYTREEMCRLDVGTLSSGDHPYTLERAMQLIERAKRGEKVRTEWRRRNRDGTLHWDEVTIHGATIAGRKRILVFTHEITERKAAEEALRSSEEQYRAIFDASADGMILFDGAGRIVDVNPAIETIYGYSREEFMSRPPHRRFHDSAHAVLDRFLERLRSGWFFAPTRFGKPIIEETRETTRDGRILELEAHLVSMHYQGRPHVLAIKRDITERKQREHALARSENRLRATVEAALDCIVSMDAEGRIVEFNAAAENCFGYSREQVIGQPLADLIIPPSERAAHERGMRRYRKRGRGRFLGRRVEVNAMRSGGDQFPAELAIAAAEGAEGDIFVGYLRDISEQRRIEIEREKLEQQLRQSQKMEAIGHLTGGIAHDFNNILTSILGYTMMAGERAELGGDPALVKYLDQIRVSGERARDLIRQMLTFSRGQRGEPRLVLLPRLVEDSIGLFRSTFPSSTAFSIRSESAIPPVMVDPIQFEQVLMNLCINARDAMNGVGDIAISVTSSEISTEAACASCRQSVAGVFVELSVTDTGHGIDAEVRESMFEPFFTTKEVGQGSGMGLSTAHGIVHEHGGHILVENARQGGARFRILLPAARGTVDTGLDDAQAANPAADTLSGRVLVVDDEVTVLAFLRELFESRGLTVDTAGSGGEALHLMADQSVGCDLVITDQTMPRMTGVELAYRLKATRPGLPVILVSGFSDSLTGRTPGELGVEAVFSKPIDHRELMDVMRQLLPARPGA